MPESYLKARDKLLKVGLKIDRSNSEFWKDDGGMIYPSLPLYKCI